MCYYYHAVPFTSFSHHPWFIIAQCWGSSWDCTERLIKSASLLFNENFKSKHPDSGYSWGFSKAGHLSNGAITKQKLQAQCQGVRVCRWSKGWPTVITGHSTHTATGSKELYCITRVAYQMFSKWCMKICVQNICIFPSPV